MLNDLPVLTEIFHRSKTGHIDKKSVETWWRRKRVVLSSFGKLQVKNLDSVKYFHTLGLSLSNLLHCMCYC